MDDSASASASGRVGGKAAGWTRKTRKLFLEALSLSGNVREAVQAVGMTHPSAYALRRRDPAFAAAWTDALHAAYARIEDDLLAHVISTRADGSKESFDPAFALKMLTRHEAQASGRGGRRTPPPSPAASLDEVERALTRKLVALGKRLPVQP